ncbi:unnamed protein product [Oreochromis niloticus]|nr:unnamed protein product [Mustela putorius furo]
MIALEVQWKPVRGEQVERLQMDSGPIAEEKQTEEVRVGLPTVDVELGLDLLHSRILQRKMSDSAEARACFMKWEYSRHFTFLKQADKNITVICKLCPGEKKLSAAVNSTSNLLKHLTRQHRQSLLSEPSSSSMDNTAATPAKQTKLDFSSATQKVSEDKCYADMEMELKETFESLEYISTTADIWTSHNKSFLEMTAHWIDPSTFVRGHAALACKRVRGRHTYDVIGNKIEQVHSAYGLNSKVTATVTDNGSNFIKAFRMFQKSD